MIWFKTANFFFFFTALHTLQSHLQYSLLIHVAPGSCTLNAGMCMSDSVSLDLLLPGTSTGVRKNKGGSPLYREQCTDNAALQAAAASLTWREDDHWHGDERAHNHNDQQRDGNALPIPLAVADIHQILHTHTHKGQESDSTVPLKNIKKKIMKL